LKEEPRNSKRHRKICLPMGGEPRKNSVKGTRDRRRVKKKHKAKWMKKREKLHSRRKGKKQKGKGETGRK